jgi:hypothetical protein
MLNIELWSNVRQMALQFNFIFVNSRYIFGYNSRKIILTHFLYHRNILLVLKQGPSEH